MLRRVERKKNQIVANEGTRETGHKADQRPINEVKERENTDNQQPEPNAEENFLVEHVDHQHTLNRLLVDVADFTNVYIAERHLNIVWCFITVFCIESINHGLKRGNRHFTSVGTHSLQCFLAYKTLVLTTSQNNGLRKAAALAVFSYSKRSSPQRYKWVLVSYIRWQLPLFDTPTRQIET